MDGTRAPRYRADVGVRGDRIASIGSLKSTRADVDIDAAGKIVSPGEIDAMKNLVEEALGAGAIGVSTGLYYEPARAAPTEEVIEVCRPLSARKALYCTHMRDEGEHVTAWSTPHPEFGGMDLGDIAAQMGTDKAQALARLLPAGAIYFSMDEADVQRVLAFEHTMVGSDGLADRGVLKQGAFADLCVFDADTVDEAVTFAQPIRPAKGIEAVIVNGAMTWRDGKPTGARPGRVLRRAPG